MTDADIPTLYFFPGSYFSQKAVFALEEKNIPYNSRFVNIGSGRYENYEAWFMKINPEGQVPVLEHKGRYISNSPDIIKYLDETYGEPPMMPDESKEKWSRFQKMLESVRIEVASFGSAVNPHLTKNPLAPWFIRYSAKKGILSRKRSAFLRKQYEMAEPGMKELYKQKLAYGIDMEDAMASESELRKELDKIGIILKTVNDELKGGSQWLCGPDFTVADICMAILLTRLEYSGLSADIWEGGKLPNVAAYYERMKQRKTYQRVCVQSIKLSSLLKYMYGDWTVFLLGFGAVSVLLCAVGLGFYLNDKI